MSMDGFKAIVRIDEIKICAGKHKAQPHDIASMEMTGVILECSDAGVDIFSPGITRKTTYVKAMIDCYPTPDFSEYVPDELTEECIGDMFVKIRNEKVKEERGFDDTDIRADIRLVLNYDIFNKLVALKDSTIFVEPIFFREKGEKEKKTEISEADGVRSFIERVYFSLHIETNKT
jgi:hypothetical protein